MESQLNPLFLPPPLLLSQFCLLLRHDSWSWSCGCCCFISSRHYWYHYASTLATINTVLSLLCDRRWRGSCHTGCGHQKGQQSHQGQMARRCHFQQQGPIGRVEPQTNSRWWRRPHILWRDGVMWSQWAPVSLNTSCTQIWVLKASII